MSVINSGLKRKDYSDHSSYSYSGIGPKKCTPSFTSEYELKKKENIGSTLNDSFIFNVISNYPLSDIMISRIPKAF